MFCKKIPRLSLLLAAAFLVLLPAQALALGLGVSPSNLNLNVSPGSISTETLHIINSSDEESHFQVYVEGKYEDWVNITPSQFSLSSHLSESVEIIIEPPLNASGEHACTVCIVSMSPESGFRVGAGVKIPVQMHITESAGQIASMEEKEILESSMAMMAAIGVVVLLIVVSGTLVWRRLHHQGY